MTDEQKLRAAHFREAAEICKKERVPELFDGAETYNEAVTECAAALEAAAPLPDSYVCILRAWLEEAAQDVEYWGLYAGDGHIQRQADCIQKWKERAKQP